MSCPYVDGDQQLIKQAKLLTIVLTNDKLQNGLTLGGKIMFKLTHIIFECGNVPNCRKRFCDVIRKGKSHRNCSCAVVNITSDVHWLKLLRLLHHFLTLKACVIRPKSCTKGGKVNRKNLLWTRYTNLFLTDCLWKIPVKISVIFFLIQFATFL